MYCWFYLTLYGIDCNLYGGAIVNSSVRGVPILESACLCSVLPACAGFCVLLLGSACCCCVLPADACCCLLLPAAAGFWVLHACAGLPACGGSCLLVLDSALCFWVLPAAPRFCLLLLGSACCCCWVLPCAAGFCLVHLVLLGSALCFWVLPAAAGFSACLCCVNARCPNVRNILPVGFPFMWFNLPILLSGSLLLPGLGSRLHLVFDLVFPGLDFLVLYPSLPFFGCSLVSLVGALAFLLLSSLGRCCWWMFAAVGLSLCLVVVSCLCLSSAAGWERDEKNNYFESRKEGRTPSGGCCWGASGYIRHITRHAGE